MSDLYNTPVSDLPKDIAPELPELEPVAYAVKEKEPEGPYFVSFMVNLRDWGPFMDDLTNEEIGSLIRALLRYCETGEREQFKDRALRLFYMLQCDAIDSQHERYQAAIAKMKR